MDARLKKHSWIPGSNDFSNQLIGGQIRQVAAWGWGAHWTDELEGGEVQHLSGGLGGALRADMDVQSKFGWGKA